MRALLLLPYYIHWHYGRAITSGFALYRNLIWFLGHFFSMGILARSLFQPWERMVETREQSFTFSNFLSTITVNLVIRFAGAVIRSSVIVSGLIAIVTVTVVAAIVFICWLAFPLCIVIFLGMGGVFLYKAL